MLPWLNLGLHSTSVAQVEHVQHMSSYLARLVASGVATSRSDLARVTRLARSTVSQYLAPLLRINLLSEHEGAAVTRGRPPTVLSLNPQAGVILVADIGASHGRLGVADFGQHFIAERAIATHVARGPEAVLADVRNEFHALLKQHHIDSDSVRLIVVGLPAPIDFATGTPAHPPIMPGWDNYPLPSAFKNDFATAQVLVDNDVNLMALGEARCRPASQCPILFVKVSTGIGCGIVTHEGVLHRGVDGAAGDIGHVRMPDHDELCRCGNTGCIEAFASFSAIMSKLGLDEDAPMPQPDSSTQIAAMVRTAAEDIGELLAMLVHFYNPNVIVLGGRMTEFGAEMLAGARSVVYRRALPLATRKLSIELSLLGKRAGIVGGVVLGVEHVLSPKGLQSLLAGQQSVASTR